MASVDPALRRNYFLQKIVVVDLPDVTLLALRQITKSLAEASSITP